MIYAEKRNLNLINLEAVLGKEEFERQKGDLLNRLNSTLREYELEAYTEYEETLKHSIRLIADSQFDNDLVGFANRSMFGVVEDIWAEVKTYIDCMKLEEHEVPYFMQNINSALNEYINDTESDEYLMDIISRKCFKDGDEHEVQKRWKDVPIMCQSHLLPGGVDSREELEIKKIEDTMITPMLSIVNLSNMLNKAKEKSRMIVMFVDQLQITIELATEILKGVISEERLKEFTKNMEGKLDNLKKIIQEKFDTKEEEEIEVPVVKEDQSNQLNQQQIPQQPQKRMYDVFDPMILNTALGNNGIDTNTPMFFGVGEMVPDDNYENSEEFTKEETESFLANIFKENREEFKEKIHFKKNRDLNNIDMDGDLQQE